MKIGIVVNSPSPHQKILLDCLVGRDDADVVVAYAFPSNPGRAWGAPQVEGPSVLVPRTSGLSCVSKLAGWAEQYDRDVWILGSIFTAFRTQCLARAFTRLGRPWAFLGEPPRPRNGWRAFLRDRMLRSVLDRCDGVIGTGIESARRYRVLLGSDRPVISVPYYVPLTEWLKMPLLSEVGPGEQIRFVTMAQLIHRKGIDMLIGACRLLPSDGWQLDVYGDGPQRERIQREINAFGLPVTLHSAISFEERTIALQGKHCFILPTRWDGWGMVVVEALAAGLPVITTDQAMSAYDFIQCGREGWIIPCDEQSTAKAMKRVIQHREIIPAMSVAARDSVSNYAADAGADSLVQFCRGLVRLPRVYNE